MTSPTVVVVAGRVWVTLGDCARPGRCRLGPRVQRYAGVRRSRSFVLARRLLGARRKGASLHGSLSLQAPVRRDCKSRGSKQRESSVKPATKSTGIAPRKARCSSATAGQGEDLVVGRLRPIAVLRPTCGRPARLASYGLAGAPHREQDERQGSNELRTPLSHCGSSRRSKGGTGDE
jgi:hypothetical protein